MDNETQKKARLILASLAALPSLATANVNATHLTASYSAPIEERDQRLDRTGLNAYELSEGQSLVRELNRLDVVTVSKLNLAQAPAAYNYGQPPPVDLEAARAENLERLAKLRLMIEAAR